MYRRLASKVFSIAVILTTVVSSTTAASEGHIPNNPWYGYTDPKKFASFGYNPELHRPLAYKINNYHWLYFGWESDHPKSWSFMGGSLSPGKAYPIQYVVAIEGQDYFPNEFAPDRKEKIKSYLAEGYLPSPISEWQAGPIRVRIQHFANRILQDTATAVYSRVILTNGGNERVTAQLKINAGPDREIPLSDKPKSSTGDSAIYEVNLLAGGMHQLDFVTLASGEASSQRLSAAGSFEANYAAMARHYNNRISKLAHPVILPDRNLVDMYKALQIVLWESLVKVNDNFELRAAAGPPNKFYSYDRTFSHDIPNMVEQFIREGDFIPAKEIIKSPTYQRLGHALEQDYLDAIPKFIIPYALYLQLSGDISYFTKPVKESIRSAAHRIREHRQAQLTDEAKSLGFYGIMDKSTSLDGEKQYLLVDNLVSLHGLAAYKYLCEQLGDDSEGAWAEAEMKDLNHSLNGALEASMKRRGVDWYMATFLDTQFWNLGYTGNWLGTSLMMSAFPWNAHLKGFDLGGTWKDKFDRSIEHALNMRNESKHNIPKGSWGAWWGHEYGTVYNAGMGLQTLFSERHRIIAAESIDWLLRNQSAPYQWGESFDRGLSGGDWTSPAADYEVWGLSFTKQALLEINVAVDSTGLVIIGRGIPNSWLFEGSAIEWRNIRINSGRRLNFKINTRGKTIKLQLSGDLPTAKTLFNLPVFVNNISRVSIDGAWSSSYANASGQVTIPPGNSEVVVHLKLQAKQ